MRRTRTEEAHARRRARERHYAAMTAVVAILVGAVVLGACSTYFARHTKEVTITDKERVCDRNSDGGSECKYLVFTDATTYRVTDSLVAGRFTSSDFYGRIKVCHRYKITYYGWRIGLTSSYPNLVKMTDLGKVEGCDP